MPDNNFDQPLSRTEAILQNMLGAENVLEPPMSREEELLTEILETGGGGGGAVVEELKEDVEELTNTKVSCFLSPSDSENLIFTTQM